MWGLRGCIHHNNTHNQGSDEQGRDNGVSRPGPRDERPRAQRWILITFACIAVGGVSPMTLSHAQPKPVVALATQTTYNMQNGGLFPTDKTAAHALQLHKAHCMATGPGNTYTTKP